MIKPEDNIKISYKRWAGGISGDSYKEGANNQIPDMFYFSQAVDYRTDPEALTLLPGAVKESGSVVTDLLKWGDIVPSLQTSFFYGDTGNFYKRTSTPTWTLVSTVSGSHGNGEAYFSGDDYVYLTSDSSISRYGPTQNSPMFTANFLQAQGGVPQNTASVVLASASSMYAHAADSASLSITGDLTVETYFKANTLPAVGSSMTLLGKWDENANHRSYKMDIAAISGYFGDGSDGALTISSDTTEAPIDSACTGTATTQSLSATNASFAQGQVILIHQSRGTNAGQWERNTIAGYSAGTITLGTPLLGTYTSGAQVRVLKQYSSVTVNSGKVYTVKAWNGTVGGILAFLCSGTTTVTGTITANGNNGVNGVNAGAIGGGFRGGDGTQGVNATANQGEGTMGAGTASTAANGNGGGGGQSGSATGSTGTGGSGGNGANGGSGVANSGGVAGAAGSAAGSADLTTIVFGGGSGGSSEDTILIQAGGSSGGGIVFLTGVTITVTGAITSNGGLGAGSGASNSGGGGGSILIKAQVATLGSGLITATGGVSSPGGGSDGAIGRIHLDYLTSYTGTTTPTLDYAQDSSLVTTTTYQLRLGISNNGTAFEYLTNNLASLTTGVWNRASIAWTASTSTAQFYMNAVYLGSFVGTKTAIADNVSLLYVGADKGASVVGNFFNGLLNDMRIINNVQSAGQIFANLNTQLPAAYAGLQAYYKFNSAYTDTTGNTNTLTAVNSPTFSSDVPFASPSTRLDIDITQGLVGDTYALPTAITETSVDMLDFTPVNDPQASVGFYVDTKGTGNWTVTVHDQQNRVIATQTIANANIPASGFIEFIYTTPWRILLGETYHMHVTVSTGTSKLVSGSNNNLATAEFTTYFGFLVTDTQFHPVHQFQYQPLGGTLTGAAIIGNERYLAIWDGTNYFPNFLTLPPGWRVRCFAQWRQYLAIGVWKSPTITGYHQGRIYFWTGYQPAYDFFIDVPEGQINALFGVDSDLYMFAGFRGQLLDYKGGYFQNTGNSTSNKLKKMPLLSTSDYTEVYPGALNMWRGLLHFGLYANSSSTTTQRGVYSYGTLNQYYPETLSYDYLLSTGNQGSTVSIGLVYPIGQDLIIGWRDGIACGADVINFDNPPASFGYVQQLGYDDGVVWRDKLNLQVRADFLPLATGESVGTLYSIDRQALTLSTPTATVGLNTSTPKQVIGDGRGHEVSIGVTLYATGTTSPTVTGVALLHNKLGNEDNFG